MERPASNRRIVYIHHGFGIGGANLSLLYLIEKLDRSRYDPLVACIYDGPAAEHFRNAGIPVVIAEGIDHFGHTLAWYSLRRPDVLFRKTANFWPSVARTEKLVRRLGAALVHLNTSGLPASAIGAKRAGVPVVWHIREPLHSGYVGLRRAIFRRLFSRCGDRVIPICEYYARQLISNDGVRVIPDFVDFAQFDRSLSNLGIRQELGLAEDARVVLMLGGVAMIKGTLPFVQALPAVLRQIPDAHFVIAGSVPTVEAGWRSRVSRTQSYWRCIEAYLVERNLAARAHFIGVRNDVPSLLASSDLLVFPSTSPHFARPIIEASAMAKPVVASDLGGPDELVVDGKTGLLVPAADSEALASAIVRILIDRAYARTLGEAGYVRARELYDANVNAARTIALYDELL